MIRSKTPKDEEISEENLIGKSIVDPSGHIIGKCAGVFEDEKKKLRLKIAIKTELESDFVVEETIPVQLIKNIGEVILLKRAYEIQPIAIEDIVTFELSDEVVDSLVFEKLDETKEAALEDIQNVSEMKEISEKVEKKDKTKSQTVQFNELFQAILEEEDSQIRNVRIVEIVKKITENKRFMKKAIALLITNMTEADLNTRTLTATIFNHISEKDPHILIPYFREGLESVYNEPSKDIEQLITSYLTRTATNANSSILKVNFQSFFDKLVIKRKIYKNITRNRIHNLNLKVFVNNFYVQDILIYYYLKRIIEKKEDAEEFANLLKDYNAIIIAYSLINAFDQTDWKIFLDSPISGKTFEKPFIESIKKILEQFNDGNIKEISDTVDPKLGYQFSNHLIQKMVKLKINDVLAQVSILPLDLLSSFFNDDDNRIIQIIFELINKQEIKAQIQFIDGKTFIAPRDK
ncbi:MAG: hypothetical protein KGD59_07805 [Candidatus Heimdallarchaeota archaeon]|nr:hypothetical protein [Candidatus Heimdallarchaeota archaeon]MBY8994440.1 hypothetical protein [Candidatus Heimdallarchaeota archaeon]